MKNIQYKRCFFFTPEWCPKKRDSLDLDLIRDCQYYRTKTNADKIRSMTDEELAYMFVDIAECDRQCPAKLDNCIFSDSLCKDAWLDWLKREIKE